MSVYAPLAAELRRARIERGLSQAQLAELLGVTQQQVAKLEDPEANPTVSSIDAAARALGISFAASFERDGTITIQRRSVDQPPGGLS